MACPLFPPIPVLVATKRRPSHHRIIKHSSLDGRRFSEAHQLKTLRRRHRRTPIQCSLLDSQGLGAVAPQLALPASLQAAAETPATIPTALPMALPMTTSLICLIHKTRRRRTQTTCVQHFVTGSVRQIRMLSMGFRSTGRFAPIPWYVRVDSL